MCAKNTDTANLDTKGFCWYKATNGIKRHLLVDVSGNPYFVHCTRANSSDDDGLLAIIRENKQYFLDLPGGHVVTILLDNGYHKEHLEQEIEKIEPPLSSRIRIEIAEKITPPQRTAAKAEKPTKKGFVVIKKRWIVERTNAWINQCRALWKNCEGLLRTSEAKIRICAIRLILRRIA
ncbi:MAG: transposase [Acidobacteria bacterium]|nr:transposase [Acidobacteriota bacterium]